MFGTTPDNTPDLLDDRRVSIEKENPLLNDRVEDFIGVSSDQEEVLVNDLVQAAKGHFEDLANHFVDLQKREVIFDRFSQRYKIPATPVLNLDSAAAYKDGEELSTTSVDDWFLHPSDPAQIRIKGDLPEDSVDSYRFEYTTGYDNKKVPPQLRLVLKKIVHNLYDFRSSQVDSGLSKTELKTDWDKMIEEDLKLEIKRQPPYAFNDDTEFLNRRRSQVFFGDRFVS